MDDTGAKSLAETDMDDTGAKSPTETDMEDTGAKNVTEADMDDTGAKSPTETDMDDTGAKSLTETDMEDTGIKNMAEIGREILYLARNELYMNLRYMDNVLSFLRFAPGDEITYSLATNGETLFYSGAFLSDKYLRSRILVNRAYFHVVLHCMLRHLRKKQGKEARLWDIACDAAVESIIDGLSYRCLSGAAVPGKQKFYAECRADMAVLTAEGIYYRFLRLDLPEHELNSLQRMFMEDDHMLWTPADNEDTDQSEKQDQTWQDLSDKTGTAMETTFSEDALGGEGILEQIRIAVKDDVDYRAFLRRFAAPREVMEVDGDAFDYTYYTYGLRIYGNMPLVEPPETREENRIEDFVIAVDTSMSTSGELVREFLASTWAILRSVESFTKKVNIRIIQCDNQIRSDKQVHELSELKDYMENFELKGGSATDFRPVFEYVDKLMRAGEFNNLRGLIYFTDGMGIYPAKPTVYETAFVLLEEPPLFVKMPAWATRLTLTVPELKKARQEAMRILAEEAELVDFKELPEL